MPDDTRGMRAMVPPASYMPTLPPPPHGWPLGPGQWWACGQPTRQPDDLVVYEGRCEVCLAAAEAHVAEHGDVDVPFWDPRRRADGVGSLARLVVVARSSNADGGAS